MVEYAQGPGYPIENRMSSGRVNVDVDDRLGVVGVVRLNHFLRVQKRTEMD